MLELITSDFKVLDLFITEKFLNQYSETLTSLSLNLHIIRQAELESLGSLKTNDAALAVVQMPEMTDFMPSTGCWTLAYENLQDPGNNSDKNTL